MLSFKSFIRITPLMALVLLSIMFSIPAFAQERGIDLDTPRTGLTLEVLDSLGNPVTDFEMLGRDSLMVSVIARYQGPTFGTLRLHYEGLPDFVFFNEDGNVSGTDLELTHELAVLPGNFDAGRHEFSVSAVMDFSENDEAPDLESPVTNILIAVLLHDGCTGFAPLPVALPQFSGGPEYGNAVYVEYTPNCFSEYDAPLFFDYTAGEKIALTGDPNSNDKDLDSFNFTGLTDGHLYGFQILTTLSDGTTLKSAEVRSTVDVSPPEEVAAPVVLALPGGHIQVTWNLVEDSISGVDYYLLKRKMVIPGGYSDPVVAQVFYNFYDEYPSHTFIDDESHLTDGEQYNYWVETVDRVGNVSSSPLSATEIPDGVLPVVPEVQILNDIFVGNMPFIANPELQILANSNGEGLATTDFVFFEIVRESIDGFGDENFIGTTNFISGWMDYSFGGTEYTGSVIPLDGNLIGVNNKSFFVRARAMDEVGNLSAWGYGTYGPDGVIAFARADLFPPSVISDLDGVARVDDNDQYVMDLAWNVPSDNAGSGVASYQVYDRVIPLSRDEFNLPEWSPLGDPLLVAGTDLSPHTVVIKTDDTMPTEIEFLVLAMDEMGHETPVTEEVRRIGFRDRYQPVLSIVCDEGCGEDCGNDLPVLGDQVHVSWEGYFPLGVENMKFVMTHESGEVVESVENVLGFTEYSLPLAIDGDYTLTIHPQFTDQLWGRMASLPLAFTRDMTPPSPVETLVVDVRGADFYLHWDPVNDANTIDGYVASYKASEDLGFTDFPGLIDSLSFAIPFADEFVTYQSYDLSVRPFDCLGYEQSEGNDIVTSQCLRAPVITGHEILNNNETVEISWTRPMPNASSDWRTIITIQPPGDVAPLVKTVHHSTSYHFSPIDENLPTVGYYTVTVREQAADGNLQDAEGAFFETVESEIENFLLEGNGPGMISGLEYFFLPPENVSDTEGYSITLRWDFGAREQDVVARVTHGGGSGHAPVVDLVALQPGPNTYILDLDNLKYSDGGSTYSPNLDGIYPVEIVVLDLLENEGPVFTQDIDISASHAITPRVGGYESGYYSDQNLDLVMEHVGYTLPEYADHIQYQVEAARTPDFEGTLYAVTGWFTNPTGEVFTPCQDECPDIFLRARARFSWDTADFSQATVTPWSDEYFNLGMKWIRLDGTSPFAVNTLRVVKSTTPGGPQSGVVDVHFAWDVVDDRYNGNGEGVGIGEYRVYRKAVNDTFNFSAPLAFIPAASAVDGILSFTDVNRPMEGPEGLSFVNVRTDAYVVRPVDLLGNERVRDNSVVQASNIPSAPDQLDAADGNNLQWCWAPLEDGSPVQTFVVERTIIYESLGTDYIFDDVAGEDEDFRLNVSAEGGNCPAVVFNHNSAFNNPDFPVYFHVKAILENGWESAWSDTLVYLPPGSGVLKGNESDNPESGSLVNFVLDQNFPNPFNPQTTVRYHVPRQSYVSLRIFDVRGQLVRTLVDGMVDTGVHSVQWHGNDQAGRTVSTGVYFYKLDTPNETLLKRMVLMR